MHWKDHPLDRPDDEVVPPECKYCDQISTTLIERSNAIGEPVRERVCNDHTDKARKVVSEHE